MQIIDFEPVRELSLVEGDRFARVTMKIGFLWWRRTVKRLIYKQSAFDNWMFVRTGRVLGLRKQIEVERARLNNLLNRMVGEK
jgi:hypothetical protein